MGSSDQVRRRRFASAAGSLVVTGLLLGLASGAPALAAAPAPVTPAPVLTVAGDQDVLSAPELLVAAGAPAPPLPQATGWIVADLDSGEVLAAQNARARLAPASTLKLLTALALSPPLDSTQVYTASRAVTEVDGSKAGMVEGSQYLVDDLLHALLMSSGNDAAVALGELAGGPEQAASLMNERAQELGAHDTLAVNTSGLDAAGQVSSARDLALIGEQVLKDGRLSAIAVRRVYDFPGAGGGFDAARPRFQIGNHNKLLSRYDGAIGLKNGYTVAARGSLVAAAERDGRRLVVVLVRTEGSASTQSAALLDWAFALPGDVDPVTTLEDSVQASAPAKPSGTDAPTRTQRPDPVPREPNGAGTAVGDGAVPLAEQPSEDMVASSPMSGFTLSPTSTVVGAVLILGGLLLGAWVVIAIFSRRARG